MMLKEQTKYFWLGIPILFIAGTLFHFVYGLSGKMFLVGLFAPVNESIFEHTKLFPLPATLWYGLLYLSRRYKFNADSWFTAALLSIVTHVLSMLLVYYFYTGAFGVKSFAASIVTFFMAVALGQIIGLRYYKRGKGFDYRLSISIIFLLLIIYAILTVTPPHLPIFLDPVTNTYGIRGVIP